MKPLTAYREDGMETIVIPRSLAERTEAMFRSVDPEGAIAQEWAKVLRELGEIK